jgi:hypothetical protein
MTPGGERMRKLGIVAGTLCALAMGAAAAGATETQWWLNVTASDYARAEAHGALVHADGSIVPGPAANSWKDDSLKVTWAVAPLADGSVALAGDHGRIDRWTAKDGIRPWVKLGTGQVFALARSGDGLLAGTGPNGLVYRISAKGDTTLLARTGERYVWALAEGGRGVVWAATGTRGRLLRIENGASRIALDTEESNLLCLAPDGAGGVYAGGDSKGRVYRTTAAGVSSTVYDAGEDEIRSLARDADGSVWALALAASASVDEGDDDERPAPVRAAPAGGKAFLYRIVPDSATVAWWTSPQPLAYAVLAPAPGRVLVATGNRAGVFAIERVGAASQWLAPPQGQVTALAAGPDGAVWAGTANPAALWRLGPQPASDGELLSPALDAKRFAHFGHVRWHGSGDVAIETRSGNCDPPDSTWNAWRAVEGNGGEVRSSAARYLQWKVRLRSANARLDELDIAWREQNVAPRVDDIGIAPQGLNFRDGELMARSDAVTQVLPSGQKVEYSISLPSAKAIRELPIWARGLRTLTWRASDPNGDALRYRLELRSEDGGEWVEIGKDLEAMLYTWNTTTIPDGRYRLRVTASDGLANAIGEERTGFTVSEPFTVDNTPPVVERLEAHGAMLIGEAVDATSPIWRLEASVDDGDWRTVAPEGGLADGLHARFSVTLPGLKPGPHVAGIRAVDLAGNAVTRAIPLTVPVAH